MMPPVLSSIQIDSSSSVSIGISGVTHVVLTNGESFNGISGLFLHAGRTSTAS